MAREWKPPIQNQCSIWALMQFSSIWALMQFISYGNCSSRKGQATAAWFSEPPND